MHDTIRDGPADVAVLASDPRVVGRHAVHAHHLLHEESLADGRRRLEAPLVLVPVETRRVPLRRPVQHVELLHPAALYSERRKGEATSSIAAIIRSTILTDLQNPFAGRYLGKFAVGLNWLLKIPPLLAYAATLSCENNTVTKQAINDKLQVISV